jgi:hypothetical protein
MSIDPIGPLIVLAKEFHRRATQTLATLGERLDAHAIDRAQQLNYTWLDNALWTLHGRVDAYQQGILAGTITDQAFAIKAAIDDVEAAHTAALHVITQLS